MIEPKALLKHCQGQAKTLVEDLRQRLEDHAELEAPLKAEYDEAFERGRTGEAYSKWLDLRLDQIAVNWVLACVFVRFLEDNCLIDPPRLAGPLQPENRLQQARDQEQLHFEQHPEHGHREFLQTLLGEVSALPAMDRLLGEGHNPLWQLGPTADAARNLVESFRERSGEGLACDFSDLELDTRFLGDLYQHLSELARKRYALLQTPDFVESFLLDRTLTPAIEEFGLAEVKLIDPACGSGHFLLGAFARLFTRWRDQEPGTNERVLAQRALDAVHGVDVNPFAIAIARFRLLVAALQACGITCLADAPGFAIHLAAGDSLLHGPRPGRIGGRQNYLLGDDPLAYVYEVEDADELKRILGQEYHVVVANPPYITPKDKALNKAYRHRFDSCHRQYSLAVPFKERCFDLAVSPADDGQSPAGHVGLITANSFMKREFGKKLIEEFVPRWDLTHVIDTSGAYIPGHGTPTLILLARSRPPVEDTVRAVRGIRGEPSTPDDPATGKVWTAITDQVDQPGSESQFVSVDNTERRTFERHPWNLSGGGAAKLKEQLENTCTKKLGDLIQGSIGRAVRIGNEDIFIYDSVRLSHSAAPAREFRGYLVGEGVRDWTATCEDSVWYPYEEGAGTSPALQELWKWRTSAADRATFQGKMADAGLRWFDFMQHTASAYTTPLSIAFAFVATHNHFALDLGGNVFKQTAPVIKLPPEATLNDHLALLGLLNSSVACFWMKQTFANRGSTVDKHGARQRTLPFEDFYEHDSTKLQTFPCATSKPLELARRLNRLGLERQALRNGLPTDLAASQTTVEALESRMIALQEELDWRTYEHYGLLTESLAWPALEDLPSLRRGERSFEIALARVTTPDARKTAWFERHNGIQITEIPAHWPAAYRDLIQRRLDTIAANKSIRLIEQPEYKRRWQFEPWEKLVKHRQRTWLLNRLEDPNYWPGPQFLSCASLADQARQDAVFMQMAELYQAKPDFDITALIIELVEQEAVPAQSACRYKTAGLRKRQAWETTWELQRQEDAIDERCSLPKDNPNHLSDIDAQELKANQVGKIPAPPRYKSSDFQKGHYWRLRGKLDVPKERFISLAGSERDVDPTPVVGWAGWDHLQRAEAFAAYYQDRKEQDGWGAEKLTPLLVAIWELLPWIHQWHPDVDPELGRPPGEDFEAFLQEELADLGLTEDDLKNWRPPKRKGGRGRGRKRKKQ